MPWIAGVKKWRSWKRNMEGARAWNAQQQSERAMRKKPDAAVPRPVNLLAATRGAAFDIPLSRLMARR